MKIGIRIPNISKRLSARFSVKRMVRASFFRAPKGFGVVTNPKKALYNRLYHRFTR